MNTFGLLAQIKVKRENSSGWEQENQLPIKIGTLVNQITSNTRMENKNTVWKCGIAMEKAWDGMILLVVFQHFSFARLNISRCKVVFVIWTDMYYLFPYL